ncbi:Retrovirus-related Pol polyprotein from transposon TNT 1-94 [Linum grandiflorum]
MISLATVGFIFWLLKVMFLAAKSDVFDIFKTFVNTSQNEKLVPLSKIRSDNGGEFVDSEFKNFCHSHGIDHSFSAPRTPQQNGVAERKNRTLIDIARTILNDYSLPAKFWAEAVNTACYIINRVLIRSKLDKTPYELWKNRKPNIGYFRPFGCRCFILNTKDVLGKFDAKSDEDISLQDIDNDVFGIPNAPTDIITDNPVIVSTIKVDE